MGVFEAILSLREPHPWIVRKSPLTRLMRVKAQRRRYPFFDGVIPKTVLSSAARDLARIATVPDRGFGDVHMICRHITPH
jgi:hypothetical protein